MRAAAEVDKAALLIDRDGVILDLFEQFDFVFLTLAAKHLDCLLPGNVLMRKGQGLASDLCHFLLYLVEIFGAERGVS